MSNGIDFRNGLWNTVTQHCLIPDEEVGLYNDSSYFMHSKLAKACTGEDIQGTV